MSQDGSTALILASGKGFIEVVQALLVAGADKEAKDMVGGEVIMIERGARGAA